MEDIEARLTVALPLPFIERIMEGGGKLSTGSSSPFTLPTVDAAELRVRRMKFSRGLSPRGRLVAAEKRLLEVCSDIQATEGRYRNRKMRSQGLHEALELAGLLVRSMTS